MEFINYIPKRIFIKSDNSCLFNSVALVCEPNNFHNNIQKEIRSLVVNIILILGALSVLQATLTLPGIAGIVLTIGMAVDANVLVFERIREEVRAGRTPISSIDSGYSRAIVTIIDANLTTLIAALILFYFGSGPVKGFAVTLSIGIITSMFTAIMLTRLMVVGWIRNRRVNEVPI